MTLPVITVISTGFNHPTDAKARCISSVAAQRAVDGHPLEFDHIYVEAGEQPSPKSALENFYDVAMRLPRDRIIACLDGDDWLAHDRALATVARVYEEKPETIVTYGQFQLASPFGPTPGCSPYPADEYRKDVWRASHLKTFRAGAFHRIKKDDLFFEGDWIRLTCDVAVMLPILEMAGPERTAFIREVIYIYNTANATAFYKDRPQVERAHAVDRFIRSRPRYERIGQP
jgi:hypothetical protein